MKAKMQISFQNPGQAHSLPSFHPRRFLRLLAPGAFADGVSVVKNNQTKQ
jgi:hypothetical protein